MISLARTEGFPQSLSSTILMERSAINNGFVSIEDTVRAAALRMRANLSDSSYPGIGMENPFLYFDPAEDIYVTDRPELIFAQGTEELHTVTSTIALKSFVNGFGLMPPELHHRFNIETHRGVGLNMFSVLTESFGLSTMGKDTFLWLSDKVDAESIEIDRRQSLNVQKRDEIIENLLFLEPNKYGNHFRINPLFLEIFSNIRAGRFPTPTGELKKYAEYFLDVMAQLGARDGWYIHLYGMFVNRKIILCIQTAQPENKIVHLFEKKYD